MSTLYILGKPMDIEAHMQMDYALVQANVMKREAYLKRWGVAWVSLKEGL